MASDDAQLLPAAESEEVGLFSRLHPTAITSRQEIQEILESIASEGVELRRGMNRRILPEVARIKRFDSDGLLLHTENFDVRGNHRINLNFLLDGVPYFFSSFLLEERKSNIILIESPSVIYQSERRDRLRHAPREGESRRVAFLSDRIPLEVGRVVDISPQGLGVIVPTRVAENLDSDFRIRFLDGDRKDEEAFADLRRRVSMENRKGWCRIGLDVSSAIRGSSVKVEKCHSMVSGTALSRVLQNWRIASAVTRVFSNRMLQRLGKTAKAPAEIRVVDYRNDRGERIRAIVDSTGSQPGAPVVVIPPAWGKTKESVMPLALCLVSAFRTAGMPLSVIRFDGIRKRGESHAEFEHGTGGGHQHQFSFSQGVRDISATLDFLDSAPEFQPSKRILVSFSAASIEARRVVSEDSRIDGWVSVVGASDLQSMLRIISGGVDFAAGMERGIEFGVQQILGIEVDMDHAGSDAFKHELASLEDARRDMARIRVPVTWIHGHYDAWMNAGRAIDALSRGEQSNRKFIEIPTGHMLRSSREAIGAFQLITREVSQMILGHELAVPLPDLAEFEERGKSERKRLPKERTDYKAFWRDYLVGRSANIGIELMTSISPYQELMEIQCRELRLGDGDVVADLGSGTGAFPAFLSSRSDYPEAIEIVEIDFVREGLDRTRKRFDEQNGVPTLRLRYVETNLNLSATNSHLPVRDDSVDAVLASLLVSYVEDPSRLLAEAWRILRPGGTLVISSLRPDADMSKLYMEGIRELRAGLARRVFGKEGEGQVEKAARSYLDQATRLLDLEELGSFRFWDGNELCKMLSKAAFRNIQRNSGFGNPPQAAIVSGRKA